MYTYALNIQGLNPNQTLSLALTMTLSWLEFDIPAFDITLQGEITEVIDNSW